LTFNNHEGTPTGLGIQHEGNFLRHFQLMQANIRALPGIGPEKQLARAYQAPMTNVQLLI